MKSEEKDIMADMFYFLRDHNDPPVMGTDACTAFWDKTAKDMSALVGIKWNNHTLAMQMGLAIYEYLGEKCKARGGIPA